MSDTLSVEESLEVIARAFAALGAAALAAALPSVSGLASVRQPFRDAAKHLAEIADGGEV